MKIHGIPAIAKDTLAPDQWVNIWQFTLNGSLEYYATCQVKDLSETADFDEYDPDEFVLERVADDDEAI